MLKALESTEQKARLSRPTQASWTETATSLIQAHSQVSNGLQQSLCSDISSVLSPENLPFPLTLTTMILKCKNQILVLPGLQPFKGLLLPLESNPDTLSQPNVQVWWGVSGPCLRLCTQLTPLDHSTVITAARRQSLALSSRVPFSASLYL